MKKVTKADVRRSVAALGGSTEYSGNEHTMWIHGLPQRLVDDLNDQWDNAHFHIKKHVHHKEVANG